MMADLELRGEHVCSSSNQSVVEFLCSRKTVFAAKFRVVQILGSDYCI